MVAGIDRYLDRVLAEIRATPLPALTPDDPSLETAHAALETDAARQRARLRELLGVVDEREAASMEFVAPVGRPPGEHPALVGRGPGYLVHAVRWGVFREVRGEGLLVTPVGEARADLIIVPDCDWTPEQVLGLAPGLPEEQQFARRFAEAGCRLIIPALIDRGSRLAGNPGIRSVQHSQRETLWRAAYEMGRTPPGYEIQQILAAADWLTAASPPSDNTPLPGRKLGLVGYGEGGLLALHAGALDPRFAAIGVCGAFGLTSRNPELPIYRNVWSLLRGFGDAQVARWIPPRALVVEHGKYPEVTHTDAQGGAPGRLWRPQRAEFQDEANRLLGGRTEWAMKFIFADADTVCGWATAQRIFEGLSPTGGISRTFAAPPTPVGPTPSTEARTERQYRRILEDTQWLMRESRHVRKALWSPVDRSSAAAFVRSAEPFRGFFATNVVGWIPPASLPPSPRTRFLYETNGYRGYEVMLDVHPDVFAHGILLVPNGIPRGERRPVVVCQHGLEGRPRDVADPKVANPAYHQYACRLAERGFITFAPQNPYLGRTTFRQVLRKAQPLGLTLWSFIVRQHEVITDWLASREFVDPDRIAFYGLSYGGKTAMRVPVLVDRYCLSICSADYNEWIWKNVSAREPYSYLWTIEYDMPEWNLGNTFDYAELSWLIFPRPFMVERGHDDGVAPDEWVAYEYARTRRHYVKLGHADRTEIEFFDGPHSINGQGTFDFLHRHLNWPRPGH